MNHKRPLSIPAILNSIWQEGTGATVFLPTQKRPGRAWNPGSPHTPPLALDEPIHQEWGWDRYFTPMTFFSGELRADMVAPGSVLYADLDEGDPWKIDPTILWETSPGSLQAIWFTTKCMSPVIQAELNKRLTYFTGADKGGWSAAKVLRIPETLNFKRAYTDRGDLAIPRGKVLHIDYDMRWDPGQLSRMLPPVESATLSGAMPDIPTERPSFEGLPIGLVALFTMRYDDRSKRCFTVAREFAKRGLPIEQAWAHLWHAPFNKYTDRPEVLWDTLLRAYAEVRP